jgi:hypothetical protein
MRKGEIKKYPGFDSLSRGIIDSVICMKKDDKIIKSVIHRFLKSLLDFESFRLDMSILREEFSQL